ncbi:aromatic acid exporter family protein [Paenibacillus turpanensis]|uniref:aromatic acid exporter family protein n=1 Tax=Paenibacillus turpanensis TaxID=2689078 RepID=UPI00140827B6|nr:aromatic acid exporter family protein [Paenibacillus turpanensis]
MGIRVIKTAIAAVVAVYIANAFGLAFATSAGLLAVLGTDITRRKSLHTAFVRSVASIIGLLFAVLIFSLFGFYPWVIGVFILAAYPVLSKVKLKDGIVTSSVIVIHVYSVRSTDPQVILNEVFLLLIGLGTAMVVNLIYMPRSDLRIKQLRERVEDSFSAIFLEFSRHLKEHEHIWNGEEYIQAHDAIEEGLGQARRSRENQLLLIDDYSYTYFLMRKQQLDSIQRMMELVAQVYRTLPHSRLTAELFEELSVDVKSEYYAGNVEKHLVELEAKFRSMPLPETREEFEVRSAVFQLCLELERYLTIAKGKKKNKSKNETASQQG